MVSEWNQIIGTVKAIGIWDILDIVIVALLIYQVIKLIRETRAMQLAKGLILLLLLYFVAYNLNMKTVRFIMQNVVATGVLALVIVFQPELRRMLEHVAQTKLNKLNIFQSSQDKDSELTGVWNESISVIANACETLSKTKTGALIVFERQTKLGEIIKTGTVVDATPSNELIGNLFFVNSPLHDGAMIIRDGRICASGCFLPLSQNYTISKEMGTRHRAALGVSENSDAVVVVVSEETGTISIAEGGVIERNFTIPQLEKRLLDILGGIAGCILTGILYLLLAPRIKKESPGPVFFTQTRIGKNGKPFKLYKFRSMYLDAEERKKELMSQNRIGNGLMFKMEDDPRVTKVGKFIRKTSIDELPQFFDVLRGDMSLVGTRPPTVDEYKQYESHHKRRLSMKPGITGLWQVSGRSNIEDFEEVVKLDTRYIDHWTIWQDIKILLKTVWVVFAGHGAE